MAGAEHYRKRCCSVSPRTAFGACVSVCADDILEIVAEEDSDDGDWIHWRGGEFGRSGGAVHDGYTCAGEWDVGVASGVFGIVCCDDGMLGGIAEGEKEDGVRMVDSFISFGIGRLKVATQIDCYTRMYRVEHNLCFKPAHQPIPPIHQLPSIPP